MQDACNHQMFQHTAHGFLGTRSASARLTRSLPDLRCDFVMASQCPDRLRVLDIGKTLPNQDDAAAC